MLWLMLLGTSMYERVYAWVHMARDYGVLYNNSRPFVVAIPLLSVGPLAIIATILAPYPCLPAFSQLLPTNRLHAAQICENIGTPPLPFFFSSSLSYEQVLRCQHFARFLRLAPIFFPALWLKQGLAGQICYTIGIIPPHFRSFAHQTRVHAVESFQRRGPFVTWQKNRCLPHRSCWQRRLSVC